MPYLVDGSNLCGAARDRRLGLPTGEQEMVRRLSGFAELRRAFLTVIFDGPARSRRGMTADSRAGRVRVAYSGAGRSGDDHLVDLIRASGRPRDLILVTSDRQLAARARDLGARVVGCRRFADLIQRAGAGPCEPPEEKPIAGDLEDWERYFRGES